MNSRTLNVISKYKQYIGQKFNHLTILEYFHNPNEEKSHYRHKFKCKCDCGNEYIAPAYYIFNNRTKICGKDCKLNINKKTLEAANKYKQYIGQKFNHLTILEYVYNKEKGYHKHYFKCKCDCGNECVKKAYFIIDNSIKHCGLNCGFNLTNRTIDKYKQYIGQKFGHLTILDSFYDQNEKTNYKHKCKCKCDCGNECILFGDYIISNRIKTCEYLDCKFTQIGQAIEKYKSMIGQKFNKLTIIDFIHNKNEIDRNYKYQFKCKCDCGNDEYYLSIQQLLYKTPYSCNKCTPKSIAEEIFNDWLLELKINYHKGIYIPSKSNIQKKIEIDFLIENQLGIELHGLHTHATTHYDYDNPFIGMKPKNYHINKLNSAINNNIDLLQFWNTEWFQKTDIIKSIVLNKLNKSKYRGYARKCTVKEIDKYSYDKFMNEHHIQGTTRSENIRLGLFYKKNNNLISVMSFGGSRYSNLLVVLDILMKFIVSYSDRRIFNNGKLYETLGFEFSHNSDPGYWYFKNLKDRNNKLYHRSTFMKHKLKDKLKSFDPNLTEWQNMEQNDYLRIYDCGNKVYIWKK